ncbi:MAG: hypothetical protein JJ896_03910 [Rhodothermales bacterium]|nr:hypothetical protein [Rhodothermales bacterium]MBO6778781.1 hypothetical protein [Rhodothermales bacterium]
MKLDEYTLAAYLAGELPTSARQTVAAELVQDYEAREILHLACEALAAALTHDPIRRHLEDHAARPPARPGLLAADRSPFRLPDGQA